MKITYRNKPEDYQKYLMETRINSGEWKRNTSIVRLFAGTIAVALLIWAFAYYHTDRKTLAVLTLIGAQIALIITFFWETMKRNYLKKRLETMLGNDQVKLGEITLTLDKGKLTWNSEGKNGTKPLKELTLKENDELFIIEVEQNNLLIPKRIFKSEGALEEFRESFKK